MATHPSTVAAQSATLATATRTGTHWTQSELDAVREATEPLVKVAQRLNRTLYAVTAARKVSEERAERAAAVPSCPSTGASTPSRTWASNPRTATESLFGETPLYFSLTV
jgi:hypothetical protein